MKEEIILPDFSDLNIIVIGDVMIDRYLYGNVHRISPEAPVPVLDYVSMDERPGGAANVAINIKALGAGVTLVGITGNDEESEKLIGILSSYEIGNQSLLSLKNRRTTTKTRVISGTQQLLRIDIEDKHYLSADEEKIVSDYIRQSIANQKPSGIILQDYNKGLLTSCIINEILALAIALNIPTFVDPKQHNFFAYKGCTIFKPNRAEIASAYQKKAESLTDLQELDQLLRKALNHKISFITLSGDGIFVSDGNNDAIIPAKKRNISDVSGAGDTVLSILSLCYLKGMDILKIASIANIAGGQVCAKPGVVAINLEELKTELRLH